MKNIRIIIFSVIILICIIAIVIGLYIQMTENDYNKAIEKTNNSEITEDEINMIKNNFKNIFQNNITGNSEEIVKKAEDKDVVYTSAEKKEIIPNKYDLDVEIPQINIEGDEIQRCNSEIKNLFQNKAASILTNSEIYTVYSVKYHVYINDNIISLIIKANLKEGTDPEREIIKTYNYDVQDKKILSISDIIEKQNLNKNEVQEKISEEIKKQSEYEQSIVNLGYEVYSRNINDQMYRLENASTFILGEQGHLYLIYAYGNNNYTSETDLIII